MSNISDFKELKIWIFGMEIVISIYPITTIFPEEEKFDLVSQMRGASISIPSNIPKGHIKSQTKEFARYLNIALGSYAELETLVLIARNLNYIDDLQSNELMNQIISEAKQISSLKNKLKCFKY